MFKLFVKHIGGFCLLLAAGFAMAQQAGIVQSFRGDAQLRSGNGVLAPLAVGQPVNTGSQLVTGQGGEAVVRFTDGHLLALKDNSTVSIASYVYDQQRPSASSFAMELIRGGLRSITGLLGKGNPQAFRVTTAVSTIGIRGSDWVAAVDGNSLYTGVTNGGIVVNNGVSTLLVDAGQFSATSPAASALVTAAEIPAGVFGGLQQMQLAAATGVGSGSAASAAVGGISTQTLLIGAGLAGIAAAATAESGTSGTTGTTGTTGAAR